MGPWQALIEKPRVEVINTTRRENITQQQVRIEIALGNEMVDALLLVPDNPAPGRKRPAVLVTYYDAETGVGLGAPLRDYGWQLAKRGFVDPIDWKAQRPDRSVHDEQAAHGPLPWSRGQTGARSAALRAGLRCR